MTITVFLLSFEFQRAHGRAFQRVPLVWQYSRHRATKTSVLNKVVSLFTFMLPCCIVIHFFLNNQPDALIIQIYSVIKLYMFRASCLPIIRSYLLTFGTGKFRGVFWWPYPSTVRMEMLAVPSWLCLETVIKNLHETYQRRMYSRRLLMMVKEVARNM